MHLENNLNIRDAIVRILKILYTLVQSRTISKYFVKLILFTVKYHAKKVQQVQLNIITSQQDIKRLLLNSGGLSFSNLANWGSLNQLCHFVDKHLFITTVT